MRSRVPQRRAEWVEVPVTSTAGDVPDSRTSTMPMYVVRPEGDGPWPAVLVSFEMFGVTGYVRGIADRLAEAGYLTIVPDFYHRHSTAGAPLELTVDAAGRSHGLELVGDLRREDTLADVRAAMGYLAARTDTRGTPAMLGLSVGGHIAYYAATQLPLAALVVFYPGWLTGTDIALSRPEPTLDLTPKIAELGTPVLFLVGERDHLVTAAQRRRIAERLEQAGARRELVVYRDAPHGFFCDERESYQPEAAGDAWDRILRLLGTELGSGA